MPGVIDPWANGGSGGEAADPQIAVQQAPPEQVDEQRGLLGGVLEMLQNQMGLNPQQVAQEAGVGTANVSALGSGDLVQLTLHLARTHPEIVMAVAQRFPLAQQLLPLILGGNLGASQQTRQDGAGGLIGSVLGGLLGGNRQG
ncbi:MAG: hypothetical protein H7Z41_08150 [Cytophagales bacterium]|nr:hypothetical protein [Armatimonadota bacterium]